MRKTTQYKPNSVEDPKLVINIAKEIFEANAMTLATCDANGQPSARIVLLKEIVDDGYIFYSNYDSNKGKQIEQNNKVSLLFLWKKLERQVRIEGNATKTSTEKSTDYFHERPKGSQIGAWTSPQSRVISRKELDQRAAKIKEKYINENELPLPPFWGGYIVKPHKFEFWQGRQNRLHDRIVYDRSSSTPGWRSYRIAP